MTSKKLTALEALELLKKLKKNNIDDQMVEDMLLDIIEEELKEHRLLKKIEKELGIDLITLFKALIFGIWTNQEQCYGDEKQGKIRFFQVRLLLEENALGCIHNSMWKGEEVIRTLYFKDYGKTWALTKEELENE